MRSMRSQSVGGGHSSPTTTMSPTTPPTATESILEGVRPSIISLAPLQTMRTMRSQCVGGGHSPPSTATMSPTNPPAAAESIAQRLLRKRPLAVSPALEEPQQSTRGPVLRNEPSKEESEDLCPICLCELAGSDFGTTSCGHSFHADCLSTWMIQDRRHTCPECRAHVGASASRSRMFAAAGASNNVPVLRARMPRFHGG